MTLMWCGGWRCSRMISPWTPHGPNPAAVRDPEHFSIENTICGTCGTMFCDRCKPVGQQPGPRDLCLECHGRLEPGQRWEKVNARREPKSVRRYRAGKEAVERQDYATAVELLTSAVRQRPEYVAAHEQLGFALAVLGSFSEAIGNYEAAIRLQPGRAQSWYDKGRCHMNLGDNDAALRHYEKARTLRPEFVDAWVESAVVLLRTQRDREALGAAEHALGLEGVEVKDRDDRARVMSVIAHARFLRAHSLSGLGDDAEALAEIDRLIDRGPDLPDYYHLRGRILSRLGRLQEAELALEQADRLTRIEQMRDST